MRRKALNVITGTDIRGYGGFGRLGQFAQLRSRAASYHPVQLLNGEDNGCDPEKIAD